MSKLLPFIYAFLLHTIVISITVLSAAPISQKLPDKPIDKAIRVKVHTGSEYCYAPAFVNGESYIYLNDCSSSSALPARYDVFQRIGWNVNNVWLCMTAPSSVTGIGDDDTQNWNYILLRPCVINDANQRWIIKDNAFYTADERFRVKDYGWYAYISKNAGDYYNHTLSITMQKWINTIASPANLNLKTFLGWKFVSRSSFSTYYISDNGPQPKIFDLYYNPENGHIARYFPSSGVIACMVSKQSSSDNWDWVEWKFCNDKVYSKKDIGFWNLSILTGREGPLMDHQGNFLRITQYGTSWGIPYTAKPGYLKQDTGNSPKSRFIFSEDIERWTRYVNGNLEDTLAYCPAPGKKETVSHVKTRVKRSLPPTFKLNDEWRKRLHDIATTTTDTTLSVGICGTCLLHTYQMIAELQEYYSRSSLPNRGYFFDTAPHTDPMISLSQRFPSIHSVMRNAPQFYGVPLSPTETSDMIAIRIASSTTQSILPRFNWRLSNLATGQSEILNSIRALLAASPGTVWIGLITYNLPGGEIARHAVPILRSSSGLKVIPTNTSMSLFDFTDQVSETTDPNLVLLRLAQRSHLNIVSSFATLQLIGEETNPLSVTISQNNCTGEGDDRRGNGRLPISALVNQCVSGRCPL
ncbi:DUF1561 family protein [Bartonella bacilliformis]|uniref:DUF1561 family protein n=1 Tax=Bartonella bacilliformis TaxID=774 RepID=UPI0004A05245|nr:DUF1561 family protein [Bartonella bacilliformis]KEG21578.1 hypothetical protein H703_01093 [Bartonella bacilliformis Ver075]